MSQSVSEREQRVLEIIETARAKRARFKDEQITMAHGAGGRATQTLIEGLLVPAFGSESLAAMEDAGAVSVDGVDLAITTDSFVVKPIRFPGGSIGELAVNGTVNDLAVAGARPLALSLSLILEEGLDADALRAEVEAIAAAAAAAEVEIVAGDTKVVERGHADQMYVCTTGIGVARQARDARGRLDPARRRDPGVGLDRRARHRDHAVPRRVRPRRRHRVGHVLAVAAPRTRCSNRPGRRLRCMRDATRGGVASVLNELARTSAVAMVVREAAVPVEPAVAGAAELLGIDPMYVANEGKLVAFVAPESADAALTALRAVPGCERGSADRRGEDGAAGDGARGDELRRQARDGPARRRPPTEDLLRGTHGCTSSRSPKPYARSRAGTQTGAGSFRST